MTPLAAVEVRAIRHAPPKQKPEPKPEPESKVFTYVVTALVLFWVALVAAYFGGLLAALR